VLLLAGCELALHEVQQATTDGCDPWQAGCPALVEYAGPEPMSRARIDLDRPDIVGAAVDAPHRQCDGVGLVCQDRIIGDVLWDQYVMVLAGQSQSTSTAASAQRAVPGFPGGEAKPGAPDMSSPGAAQTPATAAPPR
jgi:hypothetical protein